VLILLVSLPLAAVGAQPARPDIVVLVIDDMRADDWRILANTERLVGGTWFPNFVYTTPLCCPTRSTIQRGQYAHNTGIHTNEDGVKFTALDHDTIATALDAAGYQTVLLGKYLNHYGLRAPGWDVWDIDADEDDKKYTLAGGYATDVLRDWTVRDIQRASSAPLFLYVAFRATHAPWRPATRHKDANVGPTINRDDQQRKRTLLAVDEAVSSIAEAMDSRWDTACVIVMSDHGFLLGEHHTTGKSIWWDEATRVPLLIRCPGVALGQDMRLAATIDVAPTILRAAGAAMGHPLDGRPLQDAWERDGVLLESWDTHNDGYDRPRFFGIKGKSWVYVEPEGERASYFTLPGESENRIDTLSNIEMQRLAGWLATLKTCAGDGCRAVDTWPVK
jgi:N-acetylglucosamine-6-sulfatase